MGTATKRTITVIACLLLAMTLATMFAMPYSAHAATGKASQTLTTGTVAKYKASPKPKAVKSLKATSPSGGKVKLTWKATTVKGLKSQTYTVRYAYGKSMKGAKVKTVKGKSLTLPNMKKGKTVYLQVRANAKANGKTVRSGWSAKKAVKVKSKWVKATGHYKTVTVKPAWDEPVCERHAICDKCGLDFTATGTNAAGHIDECGGFATSKNVQTGTIHHPAVTKKQWVVDAKGHWV